MKKKLFIMAVVSLMVCLIGFVAIVSACDDDKDGKSKQRHVDLYQKCRLINDIPDPNVPFCTPGDFPPVPPLNDLDLDRVSGRGVASGKMKYNLKGSIFKFEFEGNRLKSGESYTLIYFPKFYTPGIGLIYFGSDIADEHGNVNINGSLDTGDLPLPYDEDCINVDPITWRCGEGSGARIWLVLSSDICIRNNAHSPRMIGWNPGYYLFPKDLKDLITFADRDFDTRIVYIDNPCETDCAYCY